MDKTAETQEELGIAIDVCICYIDKNACCIFRKEEKNMTVNNEVFEV